MKALTQKGKDLVCFVTLNAVLAFSGWIATLNFHRSQKFVDVSDNPTPLGYFKSLVLFILPCCVFGVWLQRYLNSQNRRKAFWITIAILFPLGLVLDFLFALCFLKFENSGSVLGSLYPWCILPAFDWHSYNFRRYIPIEEVFFYFLGFLAILLTYIWSDEILFGSTKVSARQTTPIVFSNWTRTLIVWLVIGAILFVLALLVRSNVPAERGHAFPGYFLFLLLTAIVPSMVCSRLAFHFVNFRALTLAWLFVLGISQFWEGALAIPYQWWGYQSDQMMGFFIKAQCDLPIEAVLVWTLATWATVMVYETVLNVLRTRERDPNRPISRILRGEPEDISPLKQYYLQQPKQVPE